MSTSRNPGFAPYVIAMSADVIPSAKKLAVACQVASEPTDLAIRQFSTIAPTTLPIQNAYVMLGHASKTTYGQDLSPAEFVTHFKEMLQGDIKQVKHVYLIGCEMGLPDENGVVLAQKIADEFQRQGFSNNIQIHAVSKPDDISGNKANSMYAEIIHRLGAGDRLIQQKTGYNPEGSISSYLFTDADSAKKYNDLALMERLSVMQEKEMQKLKSKATSFLKNADPLIELNKEYNIYKPNESQKTRNERIEPVLEEEKRLQQARSEAVLILRNQAAKLRRKKKKKSAERLDPIASLLELRFSDQYRNHATEWMSWIKQYIKKFSKRTYNTPRLLECLSNGDIKGAREVYDPKSNQTQPTSTTTENRYYSPSTGDQDERLLKDLEKPSNLRNMTRQTESSDKNMANAKAYIDYLHAELSKELGQNRFIRFFTDLMGTKDHKKRALEELQKCNNFSALQEKVKKLLDPNGPHRNENDPNKDIDPEKVLRSVLHTRTKDILEAIQTADSEKLAKLGEIAREAAPNMKRA